MVAKLRCPRYSLTTCFAASPLDISSLSIKGSAWKTEKSAVQLKFYQNTGRFPSTINEIPETPLHYLADQQEADVFGIQDYEWSGRTGARHRREILNFLGIRRVSATDKHAFSDWLINTLYPHGSDPADATEAAFGWFQQRQVECPADKELDRLVRSSFQQFELHLYQRSADSLSTDSKMLLEASLGNDADGVSFGDLKADPGRVGLESVLKEIPYGIFELDMETRLPIVVVY